MLRPYLDDPVVQTEAALALVQVAPALLGSPRAVEVKQALERISASEKDEDTRKKAARLAKGQPAGGAPKQKAKAGKAGKAAPPATVTETPRQGALFNGHDLAWRQSRRCACVTA